MLISKIDVGALDFTGEVVFLTHEDKDLFMLFRRKISDAYAG